jgi:hypothetical protein
MMEFAPLNMFLASLPNSDLRIQLEEFINDPTARLSGQINSNTSSNERATLKIQQMSVVRSGSKHYGFEELVSALDAFDPTTQVTSRSIESNVWGGRLVLNFSGDYVFGAVMVKRPTGPRLITPPNWDGSREMLKKYNESLD